MGHLGRLSRPVTGSLFRPGVRPEFFRFSSLLQIYQSVSEKNGNRLTYGKVMGKSLVSCFVLTQGV